METGQQAQKHPFRRLFRGLSDTASFKRRLFLSFLFIAIPIIAAVLIIAFLIISNSSHTIVEQSQATELERIAASLESVFSDTENMSREIIYNSAVQDYVEEAADSDVYPEDADVASYINGMILNRDYVDSVVLISADRSLYSTENASTDLSGFQNITEKWWYPELKDSDASYLWFPYARLSTATYESQQNNEIPKQINTLMLARPIYSVSDFYSVSGYLMIYLDDEYIEQLWQDISWGKTANIFLYDADGSLLLFNSRMSDYSEVFENAGYREGNHVFIYDNTRYVLSSSKMDINGWTIHLMDSYHGKDQEMDEDSEALIRYETRKDEIGKMYRSYEQLEDRMNTLIREIYVKNLEKKDAELALLQSQINPHFLYNTLDSINWLALANDQDEISSMITALSDTFRLSLMKSSSHFIEMEQEIQYIKSYLTLQSFRYADRLTYDFDIPEDTEHIYILRFILQPVVENALKHGIDKLPGGGRIFIGVNIEDVITIIVANDGTDIDLKKMDSLLYYLPEESDILNFKNEGYGVQNIYRRIKIICGDDYGLSYRVTGHRTECRIILPVKRSLE